MTSYFMFDKRSMVCVEVSTLLFIYVQAGAWLLYAAAAMLVTKLKRNRRQHASRQNKRENKGTTKKKEKRTTRTQKQKGQIHWTVHRAVL